MGVEKQEGLPSDRAGGSATKGSFGAPPLRYGFKGSTKMASKNTFFFCSLIISGELGPIFKVPPNNNFLVWHYCLFLVPE